MPTLKFLSVCKSAAISIKILYDCRKNLTICTQHGGGLIPNIISNKFGKFFVLSTTTVVDLDVLKEEMPEECLKYLLPPPERKMLCVANLKMNGNSARLEKYCDSLNENVCCVDEETAKKSRGRKYKTRFYPDLVELVVAPPYPYLGQVSERLSKDCLKCRQCDSCKDCSECDKCPDCGNCKNCGKGGGKATSCCKDKCFDFNDCDGSPNCEKKPHVCLTKGTCECEDCGICEFCQSCYKTDCEDCATCIQTAGQNSFPSLSGGLSGEVSPRQIREMGGRWVIIGSSERRELFHESDELIAHKVRCALIAKMKVVLCISDSHKEDDNTDDLEKQIMTAIPKIGRSEGNPDTSGNPSAVAFSWVGRKDKGYLAIDGTQDWEDVAIAYEPLWALKKGLVPTPLQAQAKCYEIRLILSDELGPDVAKKVRILYGGPVDSDSAPDYANMPDIDGFLVGTIAFKLDQLIKIANAWYIKNRPDASEIVKRNIC